LKLRVNFQFSGSTHIPLPARLVDRIIRLALAGDAPRIHGR
jgi:hypothetical protein